MGAGQIAQWQSHVLDVKNVASPRKGSLSRVQGDVKVHRLRPWSIAAANLSRRRFWPRSTGAATQYEGSSLGRVPSSEEELVNPSIAS